MSNDKLKVQIIEVDPKEVKLLDLNARYMKHEEYIKLVDNIKRDGELTSVPFAWKCPDGRWEVLSGNHRVQASIEAGLEAIPLMVTEEELPESRRIAIQLSHNAIAGQDDPAILKELYGKIGEIDLKMYCGLDDKTLELLDEVKPYSLAIPNLEYQSVSMMFLPEELEEVQKVFDEVKGLVKPDELWVTTMGQYDRLLDTFSEIGLSYGVKNTATIFDQMLKIVERHKDELSQGWLDHELKSGGTVPIVSIFGTANISQGSGRKIMRAIDEMISCGDIQKDDAIDALGYWAEAYLEGRKAEKAAK